MKFYCKERALEGLFINCKEPKNGKSATKSGPIRAKPKPTLNRATMDFRFGKFP